MSQGRVFLVLFGVLLTTLPAQAQTLTAWLAVSSERPAPRSQVEVQVVIDLSSTSVKLGAYEARLTWDAQVLELVKVSDGETPAFQDPQTRTSPGELVFSHFSVQGADGVVSLLKAIFKVIGTSEQTTTLGLSFTTLDAASTFTNLLPQLQAQPSTIAVIAEPEPVSSLRLVRLVIRPTQPARSP